MSTKLYNYIPHYPDARSCGSTVSLSKVPAISIKDGGSKVSDGAKARYLGVCCLYDIANGICVRGDKELDFEAFEWR